MFVYFFPGLRVARFASNDVGSDSAILKIQDNPAYKGVWAPKKIPNSQYVGDSYILPGEVGAVGFELWVVRFRLLCVMHIKHGEKINTKKYQ